MTFASKLAAAVAAIAVWLLVLGVVEASGVPAHRGGLSATAAGRLSRRASAAACRAARARARHRKRSGHGAHQAAASGGRCVNSASRQRAPRRLNAEQPHSSPAAGSGPLAPSGVLEGAVGSAADVPLLEGAAAGPTAGTPHTPESSTGGAAGEGGADGGESAGAHEEPAGPFPPEGAETELGPEGGPVAGPEEPSGGGSTSSGGGSGSPVGTEVGLSGATDGAAETEPFRFFSPTSFWNEVLPAAPVMDSTSASLVKAFSEEIAHDESVKDPPWINTTVESVPIYTVPANQPTVLVNLEKVSSAPLLQAAWSAVPLPPEAHPAAGTDKVLVVWQPSTNKLWDFWRLAHTSSGWNASWGGAMQGVSSDPGVYGPEAWPGAKTWWGDSASSLEPVGGLISLEDLAQGRINHALGIAIPSVRAGVYASPARRTDGKSTNPLALPEGAHLRLDPNLDLAALHLPRVTLMIAEAAQRYGLFVRDYAPDVTFYAQDPTPTGTDPYSGASGYFEGKSPRELLESFPWSHLEVLKMELHSYS
jgi:hypothetical protein